MIGTALLIASLVAQSPPGEEPSAPPIDQWEPSTPSEETYGLDTTSTGFRAARFGLELLGGGVAWLAVGSAVTALGCAIQPADGWCILGGIVFGGGLGAAFGVPLGVFAVGHLMDGTGSPWWTVGGSVLGSALGLLLLSTGNGIGIGVGLSLPLLLSAVAYELSSSGSRVEKEARRSISWMITPTFGDDSAGVGFAMTF